MPYEPLKQAMDIDVATVIRTGSTSAGSIFWPIWEHVTAAISVSIRILTWMILLQRSKKAKSVASLTKNMKHFDYYSRAYGAVLRGKRRRGISESVFPMKKQVTRPGKKSTDSRPFLRSLTAFTTRILMTSGPAEAMATAAVIWGTIL